MKMTMNLDQRKWKILLTHGLACLFISQMVPITASADIEVAQRDPREDGIATLLTRLDLTGDGLKYVQQFKDNPARAVIALLEYYRSRTAVSHPMDSRHQTEYTGPLQESDLQIADDALRHVFIGQRAYPAFDCGKDIDWNSRPVKDMEWVWQLNRMYFWDAMARVYQITKDEKYADAWCHQMVDWTIKNPNDADHTYAWRSIEAGIRGKSWTGLFFQFLHARSFSPEVLVAMLNSCYDHASYLMTKYRSGSNWALMEAEGLAFIAMTFPEFKQADVWRKEGIRRLNVEIKKQVYRDGHQRELAMGYHIGCINWFLRTYQMAQMNGHVQDFPSTYLSTIEKMCEVPLKLCMPDGTNVPFGDAWMGSPGQHDERFLEWSRLFERPDFLYLATKGSQGEQPTTTTFALPQSGLYSMRSSWSEDAICLVLKCGPDGGGHCQPDNGTFDLYAGHKNLMPDAGSYIYSGDPEGRSWFRQSRVHQTLTLNGKNTAYAPMLHLWKPGENLDILVVENQSYARLRHRRSVIFVDHKYFIIIDEALGSATGWVDVHYQLAPGHASFDSIDFRVNSSHPKGWNVAVQTMPEDGLQLQEEEGYVSYEYTKMESRPAFRYRRRKDGPKNVRFVTIVQPYEGITVPDGYTVSVHSKIGDPHIRLTLAEGNRLRKISFGSPSRSSSSKSRKSP